MAGMVRQRTCEEPRSVYSISGEAEKWSPFRSAMVFISSFAWVIVAVIGFEVMAEDRAGLLPIEVVSSVEGFALLEYRACEVLDPE
jgi:hypothetical protein